MYVRMHVYMYYVCMTEIQENRKINYAGDSEIAWNRIEQNEVGLLIPSQGISLILLVSYEMGYFQVNGQFYHENPMCIFQ